MDDILIKTQSGNSGNSFILDLEDTYSTLKRYVMKLNPSKCTLGVNRGKFLGYIVTEREIEVSVEKVKAIVDTTLLRSEKKSKS